MFQSCAPLVQIAPAVFFLLLRNSPPRLSKPRLLCVRHRRLHPSLDPQFITATLQSRIPPLHNFFGIDPHPPKRVQSLHFAPKSSQQPSKTDRPRAPRSQWNANRATRNQQPETSDRFSALTRGVKKY